MRKTFSLLTVAAVLAVGVPAISATGHAHHAKAAAKAPAKKAVVRCPVRGEVVKNIKTAAKSTYKGKTYYFCCPGCKPLFDKNPEKYIKAKSAKTTSRNTRDSKARKGNGAQVSTTAYVL